MFKTCYRKEEHLAVSRVYLKGYREAITPYGGREKPFAFPSLSAGKGLREQTEHILMVEVGTSGTE